MKLVALENLDARVADLLKRQEKEEPIVLTKDSTPIGLLLKMPDEMQHSKAGNAVWAVDAQGRIIVTFQVKPETSNGSAGHPVFGSCRRMLSVVAEDDEHLKDFHEYMP